MAPNGEKSYTVYTLIHASTVVLRFVLLAPTIYYSSFASNNHKLVSNNILLHNGTYNPAIVAGERLADKWGTFVLIWNMLIWIPTLLLPPPLQLPVAVGDSILTGYLSRATAYQSGYAPTELKACRDMSKFYDQRPPGTNESFFAAAARLNQTVATPTKMCETFVREWQYGVTLSFFYAFTSLIGIVAFVGCIRIVRRRTLTVYEAAKWTISATWMCTMYILFWLFSIPVYIFRCFLPIMAKAPVRTARRCAVKAVVRVEQQTEFALKELKTGRFNNKNTIGRYKGAQGQPTPLAKFLGVYDILMLVTPYLHYADAINLASVSKSVRHSVLPPDDFYRRLALFKTLTCSDAYRAPCWVCSSQTCADCFELARVTLTPALHHLENCEPYCMSCYYQHVALRPPPSWSRFKSSACKCAPISVHSPKFYKVYKHLVTIRNYGRVARTPGTGDRPVCRACSILTSDEMTLRKNESGKIMLKKGQKSGGQKWETCAKEGCGKRLGHGPRFWICTGRWCRMECTSYLHQAWGADSKGAEEAV